MSGRHDRALAVAAGKPLLSANLGTVTWLTGLVTDIEVGPNPFTAPPLVVLDSDLRTAPISLLPSVPLTRGAPLLVVGQTPTQYDRYARLLVRAPSAGLMTAVADLIAPEA